MNLSHLAVCLDVLRQQCDAVGTGIGAEGVPWSESDAKPKMVDWVRILQKMRSLGWLLGSEKKKMDRK